MSDFISRFGDNKHHLHIHFDSSTVKKGDKKAQEEKVKEITSKIVKKLETDKKIGKIKQLTDISRVDVTDKGIKIFSKTFESNEIKNKAFKKWEKGDKEKVSFFEKKAIYGREVRKLLNAQTPKDRIFNALTGIQLFFRRIFLGSGATLKEKELLQNLAGNPSLLKDFFAMTPDEQFSELAALLEKTGGDTGFINKLRFASDNFKERAQVAKKLQKKTPSSKKLRTWDFQNLDYQNDLPKKEKSETWDELHQKAKVAREEQKKLPENIDLSKEMLKDCDKKLKKATEELNTLKKSKGKKNKDAISSCKAEIDGIKETISNQKFILSNLEKAQKEAEIFLENYEEAFNACEREGEAFIVKEHQQVLDLKNNESLYLSGGSLLKGQLESFKIKKILEILSGEGGGEVSETTFFRITKNESNDFTVEIFKDPFLDNQVEYGEEIESKTVVTGFKDKDIQDLVRALNSEILVPPKSGKKRVKNWEKLIQKKDQKTETISHKGHKASPEKDFQLFMNRLLSDEVEITDPNWRRMRLQAGLSSYFNFFDHIKSSLAEVDKEIAIQAGKELVKQALSLFEENLIENVEFNEILKSVETIENKIGIKAEEKTAKSFSGFRNKLTTTFSRQRIDPSTVTKVKTEEIGEIAPVKGTKAKLPSFSGLESPETLCDTLESIKDYAFKAYQEKQFSHTLEVAASVLNKIPLPEALDEKNRTSFLDQLSTEDQHRLSKVIQDLSLILSESSIQGGSQNGNLVLLALSSAKIINHYLVLLEMNRKVLEAKQKGEQPITSFPQYFAFNLGMPLVADPTEISNPTLRARFKKLDDLQGRMELPSNFIKDSIFTGDKSFDYNHWNASDPLGYSKYFISPWALKLRLEKEIIKYKKEIKESEKELPKIKKSYENLYDIAPSEEIGIEPEKSIAFLKYYYNKKAKETAKDSKEDINKLLIPDATENPNDNLLQFIEGDTEAWKSPIELTDLIYQAFYFLPDVYFFKEAVKKAEETEDQETLDFLHLFYSDDVALKCEQDCEEIKAVQEFFSAYRDSATLIDKIEGQKLLKNEKEELLEELNVEKEWGIGNLNNRADSLKGFLPSEEKLSKIHLKSDRKYSQFTKEEKKKISKEEFKENLDKTLHYGKKLTYVETDFGEKGLLPPAIIAEKNLALLLNQQLALTFADETNIDDLNKWKQKLKTPWDGETPYFKHDSKTGAILDFRGAEDRPKYFFAPQDHFQSRTNSNPFSLSDGESSAEEACINIHVSGHAKRFPKQVLPDLTKQTSQVILALSTMGGTEKYKNILEAFGDISISSNPDLQGYLFDEFFKTIKQPDPYFTHLLTKNKGEMAKALSSILKDEIKKSQTLKLYQPSAFLYYFAGNIQKWIPEDFKNEYPELFLCKNIAHEAIKNGKETIDFEKKQVLFQYAALLSMNQNPSDSDDETLIDILTSWGMDQSKPSPLPLRHQQQDLKTVYDIFIPVIQAKCKKDAAFAKKAALAMAKELQPKKELKLTGGNFPNYEFEGYSLFMGQGILLKKDNPNPLVQIPERILMNSTIFGEIFEEGFYPDAARLSAVKFKGLTYPCYQFEGPGGATFRVVDFGTFKDPLIELRDPEGGDIWFQKTAVTDKKEKESGQKFEGELSKIQKAKGAIAYPFKKLKEGGTYIKESPVGIFFSRLKEKAMEPIKKVKDTLEEPLKPLKESKKFAKEIASEEVQVFSKGSIWVETSEKKSFLSISKEGAVLHKGKIGGKGKIKEVQDLNSKLYILNSRGAMLDSSDFKMLSDFAPLSKMNILGTENGQPTRIEIPESNLAFEKDGKNWKCTKGPDNKNSYAGYSIANKQDLPQLHGIQNALVLQKGEEIRVLISDREAVFLGQPASLVHRGNYKKFRMAFAGIRAHLANRYSLFHKLGKWKPQKSLDALEKHVVYDPKKMGKIYGFAMVDGKLLPDHNLPKGSALDSAVFIQSLLQRGDFEKAALQIPTLLSSRTGKFSKEEGEGIDKILDLMLAYFSMTEIHSGESIEKALGLIFGGGTDSELSKLAEGLYRSQYIANPKMFAFFSRFVAQLIQEAPLLQIVTQEKLGIAAQILPYYYDFEKEGALSSLPTSLRLSEKDETALLKFLDENGLGKDFEERSKKLQATGKARIEAFAFKTTDEVKTAIKSIQDKLAKGQETLLTAEEVQILAFINGEKKDQELYSDIRDSDQIQNDPLLASLDRYLSLAESAGGFEKDQVLEIERIDEALSNALKALTLAQEALDLDPINREVNKEVSDLLDDTLAILSEVSFAKNLSESEKVLLQTPAFLNDPLVKFDALKKGITLTPRHSKKELKTIKKHHLKSLKKVIENEKKKEEDQVSYKAIAEKNLREYDAGWDVFKDNYDMYTGTLPQGEEKAKLEAFQTDLKASQENITEKLSAVENEIQSILLGFPESPLEIAKEEARRFIQKADQIPTDLLEVSWLEGRLDKLAEYYPFLSQEHLPKLEALITQQLQAKFLLQCASRADEKMASLYHKIDALEKEENEEAAEAIRKSMGQELADMKDQLLGFFYENVTDRTLQQEIDPDKDRALLLMSVRANIRFRGPQLNSMKAMLKDPNRVEHLIMGAGKSAVIFPYLALMRANGKNLSVLVTTPALFEEFKDTVARKNLALFNQKAVAFEWNREESPEKFIESAQSYTLQLKSAIKGKKFVLSTRQNLDSLEASYELLAQEYLRLSDNPFSEKFIQTKAAYEAVKELHTLMDRYMAKLDDEMDFNNDPIFSTIFTDGFPDAFSKMERKVGTEFFETLIQMDQGNLNLLTNGQNAILPEKRQDFINSVAAKLLEAHKDDWGDDEKGLVEMLRGKILNPVFGKSGKIHYIRSETNPLLVVPTAEKDIPKENSQFGHPLEILSYTVVDYLQDGIHSEVLKSFLKENYKKALQEFKSARSSLEEDETSGLAKTNTGKYVFNLLGIDLTSYPDSEVALPAFIEQCQKKLKKDPKKILNFLREETLKTKILYKNSVENTSADYLSFGQAHQGASGTLNADMFDVGPDIDKPTRTVKRDIATDIKTTALLLSHIDNVKTFASEGPNNAFYSKEEFDAFWTFISDLQQEKGFSFELFNDSGGLVRFDDKKAADFIQKNSEGLTVKYRSEGELKELTADHAVGMLEYLGKPLSRGTDPKLSPEAHGLFTLCEGMTREELAQAVWRLRQLDKDQEAFIVMGQWMMAHFGKEDAQIPDMTDVIAYVEGNTLAKNADRNFRSLKQQVEGRVKRFQKRLRQNKSNEDDLAIIKAFETFRVKVTEFNYAASLNPEKNEDPIDYFKKYITDTLDKFNDACDAGNVSQAERQPVLEELNAYLLHLEKRKEMFADKIKSSSAELGQDMQAEAEAEAETQTETESETEAEAESEVGAFAFHDKSDARSKAIYMPEAFDFNEFKRQVLTVMPKITGLEFEKLDNPAGQFSAQSLAGDQWDFFNPFSTIIAPEISITSNWTESHALDFFGESSSQPIDKVCYLVKNGVVKPVIIAREDEQQLAKLKENIEKFKEMKEIYNQFKGKNFEGLSILNSPNLWTAYLETDFSAINKEALQKIDQLLENKKTNLRQFMELPHARDLLNEANPLKALQNNPKYAEVFSLDDESLTWLKETILEDLECCKTLQTPLCYQAFKDPSFLRRSKVKFEILMDQSERKGLHQFVELIAPYQDNNVISDFIVELSQGFDGDYFFEEGEKNLVENQPKIFIRHLGSGRVHNGMEDAANLTAEEREKLEALEVQLRVLAGESDFNQKEQELIRNWLEKFLAQDERPLTEKEIENNPALEGTFFTPKEHLLQFGAMVRDKVLGDSPEKVANMQSNAFFQILKDLTGEDLPPKPVVSGGPMGFLNFIEKAKV